jgi:transposase
MTNRQSFCCYRSDLAEELGYHRVFNLILWVLYTGMQWKCMPVPRADDGTALIHYATIHRVFAKWAGDGSLDQAFIASVRHLAEQYHLDLTLLHGDGTNTVAKKGGDGIGYSGHKHQTGEKIIAIVDNNGIVLAPLPAAPVNEADTVLLPEGLNTLKRVARPTDLKIDGSYLNLDGGFDSRRNRKAIFNARLIPNINENPRNRKTPKRGRKRLLNAAIHSLRLCVERTFAWEDKAVVALRVHTTTPLRYEADGVHHDQSPAFLRCLKLATSYMKIVRPFCVMCPSPL